MGAIVPQTSTEDRAAGGQRIEGSLRFDEASSTSLSRTPNNAGNRRTWTHSCWLRKTDIANTGPYFLGGSDTNNYFKLTIGGDDKFYAMYNTGGSYNENFRSTQLFRDTSAWWHIVSVWDTTQSSASNRVRIYVNGTEIDGTRTNDPAQNYEGWVNNTVLHDIGRATYNAGEWFNGYMSEIHFVDGQALDPSYFGFTDPLTNTWRPKKPDFTSPNDGTIWSSSSADPSSIKSGGSYAAVFDEDISNYLTVNKSTNYITLCDNVSIQCSSSFGMLTNSGSSTPTLRINGSTTMAMSGSGTLWTDQSFTGIITKIEFAYLGGSGSSSNIYGVRVDGCSLIDGLNSRYGTNGFHLPLDGSAPMGQDQSGIADVNDGTYWSRTGYISNICAGTGNGCIAGLFNGSRDSSSDANYMQTNAGNNTTATYSFPGSGIPFTKCEIAAVHWGGDVMANGVDISSQLSSSWADPEWVDITASISSPLTHVSAARNSSNSSSIFGIRIDGAVMLDGVNGNSFGDSNGFGDSNSIDKATGAFPILNTIGGTIAVPGARGSVGVAVTVYNDGGGNKYYLDGEQAGTVKFVPGQTVTFDTSDSTVSGHPFRFSGTADGSHNAFYGVEFDGSGDYLSLAQTSDLEPGSGDFTIEAWVKLNASSTGDDYIFSNGWPQQLAANGTTFNAWFRETEGGSYVVSLESAGSGYTKGNWHHVAVVRNGNTFTLYVNGVGGTSVMHTGAIADTSTDLPSIGRFGGSGGSALLMHGHISDFRYTKGTAVYTSDFQPPSVSLTNITNTKLLCCNQSTVTGSTVTPGTITANGDPAISNDNPYDTYSYGTVIAGTQGATTTGVDFDGNDKITIAQSSSQFSLQSDFTIEGWIYTDALTSDCAVFSCWRNAGGRNLIVGPNADGANNMIFMYHNGSSWQEFVIVPATTKQWQHLAYSYDHSTTTHYAFIDGVLHGTSSGTIYNDASANLLLGVNSDTLSGYFNGKMWNVRFSNSVRYSANFTPQRTPYTTDGNTVFLGCLDSSSATTAVTNTAGTITGGGDPSVYTVSDGVLTSSTKITIPHNAPSDLYYYCTNHSGMGGAVSIGATDVSVADPYAWKCLLAAPFARSNAKDYSHEVNCTSLQKALKVTNAVNSRSRSNFYGSSYYLDGSGDWISVNTRIAGATADNRFCLEGWVKPEMASGDGQIFYMSSAWNAGDYFYMQRTYDSSGAYKGRGGGGYITAGSNPANGVNHWDHVAYTCDGTTVRLFVNGVLVGSQSQTAYTWLDQYVVRLGADTADSTGSLVTGYMQDLRIYFGTPKYTQNFIPASTSPSILPETPSGVAYASELTKPTTGAIVLGTTDAADYLEVPDDASLEFGSGEFCVEGWFFANYAPQGTYGYLFCKGYDLQISWMQNNGGSLSIYASTDGSNYDIISNANVADSSFPARQWNHIAVTREGNIWRVFANGKITYEATHASTINGNSLGFGVGTYLPGATSYEFNGYFSNVRVVKGQAVYTKEFKPSDKPLTTTSQGVLEANCSLLCCQNLTKAHYATKSPTTIISHGNATYSNFNPFDRDIHTVRGQETQYATFDPLTTNCPATFSKGNLSAQVTGPGCLGTSIPMKRGKWYCEIINKAHGSTHMGIGIAKAEFVDGARQPDEGQHRGGWAMWHISGDGSYHKIGFGASWGSQSTTWEDWGEVWGANGDYDVMGLALDMDNRKLDYYKNGYNIGTPENGLTRTLDWGAKIDAANDNGTILPNTSWADGDHGMVFVVGNGQSGATSDFEFNGGQKPWKYAPPPGYQAATLANCYPRPTVVRPDKEYVTPVLWTGTGAAKQINLGFQPDLVWIKNRNSDNYDMRVFDSIRGMKGETSKALYLDTTDAEAANNGGGSNNDGALTANATGFLISTSGDRINKNSNAIVAYGWKGGGNKGTWNVDGEDRGSAAAAGLTTGDTSVLTACSINTKAGFSIVSYTQDSGGAAKNIAHGLSKAPSFVIMKHVNNSSNWFVVHTGIESVGKILYTNNNSQQDTSSDFGSVWPGATYTATATTGVSGRELILYSWTNTPGLQWFGQYEGNGDASEGVYVNLGFRPAMLWIKRTGSSGNWYLWDNKRETINPRENVIRTDNYHGEDVNSTALLDFLDYGFKLYNTAGDVNSGGAKYLYMAWAEQPSFNLYGS